ncbi:flagellar export chaperone FliS [Ammoniphilus sp. 3BR4]|uniref:flagellar export chaperone FliS n=1 Tax=Ammoniphilus sp. 3BR4 TaxID=3158265 RepID=UPI003467BFBA
MSALAQQQYQQNQVNTASPAELTLMLYKGAIRFINGAKAAIDKENVEEANNYNQRAQAIIRELLITLNMDIPLSKDLAAMYDYMIRRLIEANIKKDKAILEEVTGYCEEFAVTWAQAMKMAKR